VRISYDTASEGGKWEVIGVLVEVVAVVVIAVVVLLVVIMVFVVVVFIRVVVLVEGFNAYCRGAALRMCANNGTLAPAFLSPPPLIPLLLLLLTTPPLLLSVGATILHITSLWGSWESISW
jgi:hypothetical protein